jgi:hypothetical protein
LKEFVQSYTLLSKLLYNYINQYQLSTSKIIVTETRTTITRLIIYTGDADRTEEEDSICIEVKNKNCSKEKVYSGKEVYFITEATTEQINNFRKRNIISATVQTASQLNI